MKKHIFYLFIGLGVKFSKNKTLGIINMDNQKLMFKGRI